MCTVHGASPSLFHHKPIAPHLVRAPKASPNAEHKNCLGQGVHKAIIQFPPADPCSPGGGGGLLSGEGRIQLRKIAENCGKIAIP